MTQYIFFLGTNPALSATEAVRRLEHDGHTINDISAEGRLLFLTLDKELKATFLSNLGGTDRIAVVLGTSREVPTPEETLGMLGELPDKWMLGLSLVGDLVLDTNLKRYVMDMKKLAREQKSRVKFVTPSGRSKQLNAAQIIFNKLHEEPNSEITFIQTKNNVVISRTVQVQDIEGYELRDTQRPARDARVGMLPPKLAQIMLNVGVRKHNEAPTVILDPFCGMGTILQEGWTMGYKMIGSDSHERMIDAAQTNLKWVHEHFEVDENLQPELRVHDVTRPYPSGWDNSIDAIVTEPFLGKPLSSPLPEQDFKTYSLELMNLYLACFANLAPVLKKGASILFLFPAIRIQNTPTGEFRPLPHSLIDEIKKYGYRIDQLIPERLSPFFSSTKRGTLIYARPDAFVGRELTLWKKI